MKKIILIVLIFISFISNAQTNSVPFNLQALQKKADSGDSEALYTIGQSYLYGWNNLVKDERKAFDYFIKSASKNNDKGQNALGVCYKYGNGTDKNLIKAVEYYTKAADNGNRKAQFNLADSYQYGEGVNKDLAKAFSFYMLSANQDYNLAQYQVGLFYFSGKNVEKNMLKAKDWFDKAIVNCENVSILNGVASFYKIGYVVQDYSKVFELYSRAAQLGDNDAALEVASMFALGHGVQQNYYNAAVIYQSYADEGNVKAQLELAFLYANGDATLAQDYVKSLEQYKKAAAKNNSIGQAEIGFYNEYGYGIPVNNEEAMKWYRIAEANGNRGIRFKSKIFNPNYNPPPSKKECPVCHGSGVYVRIIRGESGSYKNVITPSQQLFTSGALAQMRATGATEVYSKPVYSNYTTNYSTPDQQIRETCNRCHGSGEVDE
jgi:TPR repeat protein